MSENFFNYLLLKLIGEIRDFPTKAPGRKDAQKGELKYKLLKLISPFPSPTRLHLCLARNNKIIGVQKSSISLCTCRWALEE